VDLTGETMESSDGVTRLLKPGAGATKELYTGADAQGVPGIEADGRQVHAQREDRNTLQATALVHEVFLRLVQVDSVTWQDRAHFFAVSATMMRRILVDRLTLKAAPKGAARPSA